LKFLRDLPLKACNASERMAEHEMKKLSLVHMIVLSVLLHGLLLASGWMLIRTGYERTFSIITAEIFTPAGDRHEPAQAGREETSPDAKKAGKRLPAKKSYRHKSVKEPEPGIVPPATAPAAHAEDVETGEGDRALQEVEPGSAGHGSQGAGHEPQVAGHGSQGAGKVTSDKPAESHPDEKAAMSTIFDLVSKTVVYPPSARRSGIEGIVKVSFRIRADGKAEDIKVSKSSGFDILDEAAVKAVKKGTHYPPVGKLVVVPVRFTLKN
jgi:protein TonB